MFADGEVLAFLGGAWCWHWRPANVKIILMSPMVSSSSTDVSRAGASCYKNCKSLEVSPNLTSSPLLQGMWHRAESRFLRYSQE